MLPAFWDGGRRLVVRFSPVEAGEWDYLVTSNVAAWEGKTGNFTANASESKGFIHAAALHHWGIARRRTGSIRGICGWE